MADDFVDGRAAGLGEVVVVERGGVAVPRRAGLRRDEADAGYDRRDGAYALYRLARTGRRFCPPLWNNFKVKNAFIIHQRRLSA